MIAAPGEGKDRWFLPFVCSRSQGYLMGFAIPALNTRPVVKQVDDVRWYRPQMFELMNTGYLFMNVL